MASHRRPAPGLEAPFADRGACLPDLCLPAHRHAGCPGSGRQDLAADFPLFVSHRRLARVKNLLPATYGWALDSGGFTGKPPELTAAGRTVMADQYALDAGHAWRDGDVVRAAQLVRLAAELDPARSGLWGPAAAAGPGPRHADAAASPDRRAAGRGRDQPV